MDELLVDAGDPEFTVAVGDAVVPFGQFGNEDGLVAVRIDPRDALTFRADPDRSAARADPDAGTNALDRRNDLVRRWIDARDSIGLVVGDPDAVLIDRQVVRASAGCDLRDDGVRRRVDAKDPSADLVSDPDAVTCGGEVGDLLGVDGDGRGDVAGRWVEAGNSVLRADRAWVIARSARRLCAARLVRRPRPGAG